jgi:hypothetical protein
VKLNGDLGKFFAFAFMVKPAVLQVWANQYQLQVVDLINMVSHHAFYSFSIINKIQLKFFVVVQGEIKFGLDPVKHGEAIALR